MGGLLLLMGPFLGFYLNRSMASSLWAVGCCRPAAGRRCFCPAREEVIFTPCLHLVHPGVGVGSPSGETAQPGWWYGTRGAVAPVIWCIPHKGFLKDGLRLQSPKGL